MRDYEPPLSREGTEVIPGHEEELAPGVLGYAIESKDRLTISIPLVIAQHPGNGDVGRFLDKVTNRCVFPTVMSRRLAAMLERRGFTEIGGIYQRPFLGGPVMITEDL